MGCCCYPETNPDGSRNCGNVTGPDACGLLGAYSEGDCPWCFFVTELSSHVIDRSGRDLVTELAARPGLTIAFDFRAVVLSRSVLGREIAELYQTHAKSAILELRKHPMLLWRALKLITKGILIAQDMLRAYTLKSHGVATGALGMDHETVREVVEVSREFAALSQSEAHSRLALRVENIIKDIAGMKSRDILEFLALEEGKSVP